MSEEKDIIKTNQRLVKALDVVYNKPGLIFWRGFIRGIGQGLGATIGVAIIFFILSWFLKELGGIPAFSDWVNNIDRNFFR